MDTNRDEYDPLKNPAVDYDRTDLSPRAILLFLGGLLVAGVFVQLALWGMFHFLARSPLFAQGNPSPMVSAQKEPALSAPGKDFENTSNINPEMFPQPRLQTNEVMDMSRLLQSEHKILYAEQPFLDSTGTVHLPIREAMKLIAERGLPVRPAGAAATIVSERAAPAGGAMASPGAE